MNVTPRDSADWAQVLHEAERVDVFAAVYHRLRGSCSTTGASDRSRWERQSRSILARNLLLRRTQRELLAALERDGLRCQPVKGVRLAQYLYGHLGARESVDIDLICPANEVPAVYARLKSLGLRDLTDGWTEEGLRRALNQPEFLFPEIKLTAANGALVELHWDWTGETFPEADLLDDAEAYAVYLCRHGAKHFWCSLQWICDIELFLRQSGGNFDWPRFWRLAKRASAERDCAASLHICAAVFGSGFGAGQPPMRSRPARRLAAKALAALKSREGRDLTKRRPALRLLQADGWKRRIRRCSNWISPAPRCFNHASSGDRTVRSVWVERYCGLAFHAAASLARSPRWNGRLAKAAELSPSDWAALVRAAGALLLAKLGLSLLPYRWVAAWARPPRAIPPPPADESRAAVKRFARAVMIAAGHHLLEMTCLPRSLALQRLLGQRGIRTGLKIGVSVDGGAIRGHAWLEWDGEPINDHAALAPQYTVLKMDRLDPAGTRSGGSA